MTGEEGEHCVTPARRATIMRRRRRSARIAGKRTKLKAFEWSTSITREIFFGPSLAGDILLKTNYRVFVLLTSNLFLKLHHEVANSLLFCMRYILRK